MATPETWDKVRHFKPNSLFDNWGDPYAIDDDHLLRLDDFRHWLGLAVIVTAGVKSSGHSSKSYHYRENGACATDIIIPAYDKTPFDLILDATRFGFTGIGYYAHWKYKGVITGGLHLDSRPMRVDNDGTINYAHSRWLGVEVDGVQQYVSMDFHNLIKYTNYGTDVDTSLH